MSSKKPNELKELFASQVVSVIGGLIAGTVLAIYTDKLLLIPGMLILIPGFLEMRGNISGTFASRLSSGLFIGAIKPRFKETHLIKGNIHASFFLAIMTSLILGSIAYLANYLILGVLTPKIILIPVLAAIIVNCIEIPLTLFATFYLYKKGYDPNNFIGPFVTSTGDITSIIGLLIAV
ncbi:MAG TPA: magnesium transporter, partial [Candidatus Nanoarchaeia archaeon]|nr:magnesium transporter [Candidatus Nanoarchaeia archaeon]